MVLPGPVAGTNLVDARRHREDLAAKIESPLEPLQAPLAVFWLEPPRLGWAFGSRLDRDGHAAAWLAEGLRVDD